MKRHYVGDPNAKTLRESEAALYVALRERLSAPAFVILYAWLRRFPYDEPDTVHMTAQIDHDSIRGALGLPAKEYVAAVRELRTAEIAKIARVRGRGKMVKIEFKRLQEIADAVN